MDFSLGFYCYCVLRVAYSKHLSSYWAVWPFSTSKRICLYLLLIDLIDHVVFTCALEQCFSSPKNLDESQLKTSFRWCCRLFVVDRQRPSKWIAKVNQRQDSWAVTKSSDWDRKPHACFTQTPMQHNHMITTFPVSKLLGYVSTSGQPQLLWWHFPVWCWFVLLQTGEDTSLTSDKSTLSHHTTKFGIKTDSFKLPY